MVLSSVWEWTRSYFKPLFRGRLIELGRTWMRGCLKRGTASLHLKPIHERICLFIPCANSGSPTYQKLIHPTLAEKIIWFQRFEIRGYWDGWNPAFAKIETRTLTCNLISSVLFQGLPQNHRSNCWMELFLLYWCRQYPEKWIQPASLNLDLRWTDFVFQGQRIIY
jgi:hypothetical protein